MPSVPSPTFPGSGTRRSASDATRCELVDRAAELFGAHGYTDTSLDAVVAAAGLTKGALYHHFRSKKDLFRAVFDDAEQELVRTVRETATRSTQNDRTTQAVHLFLSAVSQPHYHRIVLHDGPSVLGPSVADPAHSPSFAVVLGLVRRVMPEWADDDVTVDMLARFFFAACLQAARDVAGADDPAADLERAARGLRVQLAAYRLAARSHLDADAALAAPFID